MAGADSPPATLAGTLRAARSGCRSATSLGGNRTGALFVQNYALYGDETFLRGPLAFAFGALICSSARAERLRNAMRGVRMEFGVTSEVKWTKTSGHTVEFYKRIIDVFFDDPWPKFSVMTVRKGHDWQHWASNEEERFFKSYYVFLKRNIGPLARFSVYLDERTLQRSSRWNTLCFLINKTRRDDWGLRRRNVRLLAAVDSEAVELIQLVDLLLGCATSTSMAAAKAALRKHFVFRAQVAGARVRHEDWSPRPLNKRSVQFRKREPVESTD